jgi:choline dehydrogenase
MDTFDYVIVGAGSAGSVLANRLSEDAGTTICVLEAGPSDWHPYIHLPAGFIKTFHMKSINWAYQQSVDRGPQHLRAARQDAWRFLLDQWPYL